MTISRRKFFKITTVAGLSTVLPWAFLRASHGEYMPESFVSSLLIPPELKGLSQNGKKVFDLELKKGETTFYKSLKTPTIGINGSYLGPVLRLNRGDEAVFNVTNHLGFKSTIHWHGALLPAKMDGGPHQVIEAGTTWKSEFTIDQPASMLWYHSHVHGQTAEQVYYGLAGLFYIDDEDSKLLDVPRNYGVDDIPLVIQDRDFNEDGSLRFSKSMHTSMMGRFGKDVLVNGTVRPQHQVARRQMRFRILNGSNSRIYNLMFSDKRNFVQIASDGGFLEKPVKLSRLQLAPGERAEIVVEFKENDDVMLRHEPLPKKQSSQRMGMMSMMSSGNDSELNVMRLTSKSLNPESQQIPATLSAIPQWKEQDAAKVRRFKLTAVMMAGFKINGRSFDMNRVDEVVKLNDIEIWEFYNDSPMPHPMHIHDIQFRILSRNGKQPSMNERGLKDTVLVQPDELVRVIMKFEKYADQNRPYMYHCHNLEHEDAGMMGQFVVI